MLEPKRRYVPLVAAHIDMHAEGITNHAIKIESYIISCVLALSSTKRENYGWFGINKNGRSRQGANIETCCWTVSTSKFRCNLKERVRP